MMDPNAAWIHEKIDRVPQANWLYKFCCAFLFKWKSKLSYSEMYVLLYGLNRKALGFEKARELAYEQVLEIYKYLHNNKLPNE